MICVHCIINRYFFPVNSPELNPGTGTIECIVNTFQDDISLYRIAM